MPAGVFGAWTRWTWALSTPWATSMQSRVISVAPPTERTPMVLPTMSLGFRIGLSGEEMTKKGEPWLIVPTEMSASPPGRLEARIWSEPPVRDRSPPPPSTCCTAMAEPRPCSMVTLRPSRSK